MNDFEAIEKANPERIKGKVWMVVDVHAQKLVCVNRGDNNWREREIDALRMVESTEDELSHNDWHYSMEAWDYYTDEDCYE